VKQEVAMKKQIKVWSPWVRLMHWGLALSFSIAYYTRHSELDRDIHIYAGYAVGGIVIARILFGLFARDHASFWNFPPNLVAAFGYVKNLLYGKARRYVGHNPAGAMAIYALLSFSLWTVVTGYLSLNAMLLPFGIGGEEAAGELHGFLSTALVALIVMHIAGVLVASLVHRENLVRAMVTGLKPVRIQSHSDWDLADILVRAGMSAFFLLLRIIDFCMRALGGRGVIFGPRPSNHHWWTHT
jgi:cytochrome b